ncbi:hypothetical protein [Nonomuraea sp. NPDC049400]
MRLAVVAAGGLVPPHNIAVCLRPFQRTGKIGETVPGVCPGV